MTNCKEPEREHPQEFCVEYVFKDTRYVIPIYQRNYAWTSVEIEQLLNDINDVQDDFKGKYYLGSLIVNQLGMNIFEVIDGQQRLTTLYLLLSYLNNDSVDKNSLQFEAREKSNKTLHDINAIKDLGSELEKASWYSDEIIDGYAVIKNYFKIKTEKEDNFVNLFKKKLSSITIIRTQVPKEIDLNHYFEIMNTRGEQLELHEIVKAKIIGAIEGKKDKIIAATIWDACAQMDKYVQMCFSFEETNKLRIRNELFDKNWDTFRCEDFSDFRKCFPDKEYTDENKFTLREKLKAQDNKVQRDVKKEDEENERFESIISFPNFILQVNEAMNISETDNDAGLDDKKFIERLKDNWSSSEKALKFIYSLLKYRYLFDRYIIKREYKGTYKVEGRWSLQRLEAYEDVRGKKPTYNATLCAEYGENEDEDNDNKLLRLLQSCLRVTYTAPKTMHWIARVLSAVNKGANGKNVIKLLEQYCCNKVVDSDYLHRTGFGIDRIVFTYLDYILCRDNPTKFKEFQFQFRTSIEHFFPQHPINRNDVDEKNRDSFGNLALITVSANSKFSNMIPIHKVERHGEVIAQSPKLMIMSDLLLGNNREWNDDLVIKHNNEMLELLTKEINKHVEENITFDSDDAKANVNERIASAAKEFIKKKEELGSVHEGVHNDEYYRFTTDSMSKIIPDEVEAVSDWGTHNFYFFEFVCNEKSVSAQFAIYGVKTISDELYELYDKINENYKPFDDFKGKQFRRSFRSFYDLLMKTDPVEIDTDMSDEDLNNVFEKLYTQLIAFEKDFIEKMS
jgi:uncharacterized protein with ParB-like and HNH nuclease domain